MRSVRKLFEIIVQSMFIQENDYFDRKSRIQLPPLPLDSPRYLTGRRATPANTVDIAITNIF